MVPLYYKKIIKRATQDVSNLTTITSKKKKKKTGHTLRNRKRAVCVSLAKMVNFGHCGHIHHCKCLFHHIWIIALFMEHLNLSSIVVVKHDFSIFKGKSFCSINRRSGSTCRGGGYCHQIYSLRMHKCATETQLPTCFAFYLNTNLAPSFFSLDLSEKMNEYHNFIV